MNLEFNILYLILKIEMKVKAFAKINLGLQILGKREDGFHEIDTIFAKIGLHDSLEFTPRNDSKIILVTEGARIPTQKNLVFRAAWLLQKFSPQKVGVNIFLKKRISIGAGLGGGSSDAAVTLKALNKLWGLKLSREKLQNLAASLGSDVPFFLKTGIQWGRGRGEILEKIKLPKNFPQEVLVVVPKIGISTRWAFESWQVHSRKRIKHKIYRIQNLNLVNDFEKIVFREFPQLKKIKNNLLKSGAEFASLSGSGSAVFGLFGKREEAQQAARELEKFGKVFTTKTRE